MKEVVRTRGVTKVYRQGLVEVQALRGVDLTVGSGGFVALAGPSGSGKTTLLNLIGGLDAPSGGEVFLEERNLGVLSRAELSALRLSRIGFIFQSYNLIPVLTAYENAEFVLLLQGMREKERRERVMTILKEVGLEGLEDRYPREMSGGQQQRVAVARAIASEPAIILADEPTANLDSTTALHLLETMERLNHEKGATFIFSTHDPRVMKRAHTLVYLRDGAIERVTSGDEIVSE